MTFEIHISGKQLISRKYKGLLQNNKKKTTHLEKIGKWLEQNSTKKAYSNIQYIWKGVQIHSHQREANKQIKR